jgi:hypothetical protein
MKKTRGASATPKTQENPQHPAFFSCRKANDVLPAQRSYPQRGVTRMKKVWLTLAVLVAALASKAFPAQAQTEVQAQPQAQAQAPKGPTLGGHIGLLFPLVTNSGGQTTTLSDQLSIGMPMGITVKGTGRMAFDLELVPQINTTPPRDTTLTIHPGLLWNVGHNIAVGGRVAFVVNQPTWGFTPLVHYSIPIKHSSLFKTYFVEADLPVRFNRPVGAPATNAVTFGMHVGVSF